MTISLQFVLKGSLFCTLKSISLRPIKLFQSQSQSFLPYNEKQLACPQKMALCFPSLILQNIYTTINQICFGFYSQKKHVEIYIVQKIVQRSSADDTAQTFNFSTPIIVLKKGQHSSVFNVFAGHPSSFAQQLRVRVEKNDPLIIMIRFCSWKLQLRDKPLQTHSVL